MQTMIIRPPTPEEVLCIMDEMEWLYFNNHETLRKHSNYDCAQEALTCEWLIEQGMMPDTTQYNYEDSSYGRYWNKEIDGFAEEFCDYQCEDKTK